MSVESVLVFFFNDTATTEIYTLSLHDALPICRLCRCSRRRPLSPPAFHDVVAAGRGGIDVGHRALAELVAEPDRKSTRLNSSHANISYAVFCLKKELGGDVALRQLLPPVVLVA